MMELAEECLKNSEILKKEIKPKAKSRPVSANMRAKLITYRAVDREQLKNNNFLKKPEKFPDFLNKNYKSSEEVKVLAENHYFNHDVPVNKQQELKKIFSRPPLREKKLKTVVKCKNGQSEITNFRISTQNSIKIFPSRPQSVKSSNVENSSFNYALEIEEQQRINISSSELSKNFISDTSFTETPQKIVNNEIYKKNILNSEKKIDENEENYLKFEEKCEENKENVEKNYENYEKSEEIEENVQNEGCLEDEKKAATKIQALFRGKNVRSKLILNPGEKLLFRSSKTIKSNDFLISIINKQEKF